MWQVRVEGARPRATDFVGTIALTGGADDARRFVFDVTDAVDDLDERALAISFHPAVPSALAGREPLSARVGSVFLTYG